MNIRSQIFLTLAAATLLAGCDHSGSSTSPVATEPDIVTVKLAQAADKASQALDSIAGIEQQRAPATPPLEDYSNAPANLMQPVSIRWSGPIEQITKELADKSGMRFHVKGNTPAVPLTVTVDAYQKPILHVLRDIGLQAGHRADLAVDPASGVIEIRYAAGDRSVPHVHADEIK
jgi:defect-in-organelle-trafficking protein DotD